MTVRLYKSTDGSAPTLTGQVDSLCLLLRAVLVDGYGAKTAAGWTEAFDGANKKAFRMATGSGRTGFYLNIDDSGGGAGGAKEAFLTGYQTMSALATGTGQFPTSGQLNLGSAPAGAVVCRKSVTADATARPWTIVADESCFYLFVETGDNTNPVLTMSVFFGDIFSLAGNADLYKCLLIGRNNANSASNSQEALGWLNTTMAANSAGHYLASNAQGVGASQVCGKVSDLLKGGYSTTQPPASGTTAVSGSNCAGFTSIANSVIPFPNPTDGGLLLAPIWITHNNQIRGYMKGLWLPLQYRPANHGDTVAGTGAMAGKTLQCIFQAQMCSQPAVVDVGPVFIETSDTWS